jgi:hypothetical protein
MEVPIKVIKRIKFHTIISLLGVGLPTSAEFLKSGCHIRDNHSLVSFHTYLKSAFKATT